MPFIGRTSTIISKILKDLDCKNCNAFSKHDAVQQKFFSETKDKLPLDLNSGVVYKIPCSSCSSFYIGETAQLLKNRISQYKLNVKKQFLCTALSSHALSEIHNCSFDDVTILGREVNDRKRKILETIRILSNSKSINFGTDTEKARNAYAGSNGKEDERFSFLPVSFGLISNCIVVLSSLPSYVCFSSYYFVLMKVPVLLYRNVDKNLHLQS